MWGETSSCTRLGFLNFKPQLDPFYILENSPNFTFTSGLEEKKTLKENVHICSIVQTKLGRHVVETWDHWRGHRRGFREGQRSLASIRARLGPVSNLWSFFFSLRFDSKTQGGVVGFKGPTEAARCYFFFFFLLKRATLSWISPAVGFGSIQPFSRLTSLQRRIERWFGLFLCFLFATSESCAFHSDSARL